MGDPTPRLAEHGLHPGVLYRTFNSGEASTRVFIHGDWGTPSWWMTSELPHRYRNPELIARGGMGEVYRAEDADLARVVAVKLLSGRFADNEAIRGRFTREALAVARLSHAPSTVTIFDVGEHGGRPYIVMEWKINAVGVSSTISGSSTVVLSKSGTIELPSPPPAPEAPPAPDAPPLPELPAVPPVPEDPEAPPPIPEAPPAELPPVAEAPPVATGDVPPDAALGFRGSPASEAQATVPKTVSRIARLRAIVS